MHFSFEFKPGQGIPRQYRDQNNKHYAEHRDRQAVLKIGTESAFRPRLRVIFQGKSSRPVCNCLGGDLRGRLK